MSPNSHLNNVPQLQLADRTRLEKIDRILEILKLAPQVQSEIRMVFEREMELGLARNPAVASSLQMENTFLPELCDGTEDGEYLALDLGGTNFRVISMELQNGKLTSEQVHHYHVPEEVRLGEGAKLFDFLAECIHDFMDNHQLKGKNLPLGFTFSFPMTQRGLNVGILYSWTKSFNCPGVVGEDAVKMLNDAIERRGDLDVNVVAVLNDTTGTLVQGAFLDKKCAIGLILGTGANACYIENAARIEKWEGDHEDVKEVVIDIEFGAFGDNGVLDFIKSDFDRQVDAKSLLVGSYTFEKLLAGKYLGEIVRCILVKLAREDLIFNGEPSSQLLTHDSFTTRFISSIEQDNLSGETERTTRILNGLNLRFDAEDVRIVKHICHLISDRAAILVSICLASILDRMDRPETTVAVDGSLFKYHPRLKSLMEGYIAAMAPMKKFHLMLAEDGSGKGAGMVAAIASRIEKRKSH